MSDDTGIVIELISDGELIVRESTILTFLVEVTHMEIFSDL